jgi:hypothetical protein
MKCTDSTITNTNYEPPGKLCHSIPIDYPVKIHYPGCQCKHYKNKVNHKSYFLISPYKKEDFSKRFFIYDSIDKLQEDINQFPDNCVCTYNSGKYNGGIVIVSKTCIDNFCDENSPELRDIGFKKFETIESCEDNSHLINKFVSFYPCLKQYYTLVGITQNSGKSDNYTFPKGKLSFEDTSIENCCFREFTEETGKTFINHETELQFQNEKRKLYDLQFVPHSIIINNFFLRIIVL